MSIEIRNQQNKYPLDLDIVRRNSGTILSLCGFESSDLSILLVNNRKMRDLNRKYRGIDRSTDVLAFPMIDLDPLVTSIKRGEKKSDLPPVLLGDIVLSMEKIYSQAEERGHSPDHEFLILLIHGILHLIGYDHEKSLLEKRRMEKKETFILSALTTKTQTNQGAA